MQKLDISKGFQFDWIKLIALDAGAKSIAIITAKSNDFAGLLLSSCFR